jgi:hypothetical protein
MRTIGVILGFALLCASCRKTDPRQGAFFQTTIAATNAFSLFAGGTAPVPVPSEVRDLQAYGAVWMDMNVLCRFRAPAGVLDSLLAKGYQRTNWEAVARAMHSQPYTNCFFPRWDPDNIPIKECYLRRVERDHGTDMLYLVLERHSGVVYAAAEGEVH